MHEQRLTGWELVMKGQWTESGGGSEALAMKWLRDGDWSCMVYRLDGWERSRGVTRRGGRSSAGTTG